MIKTFQLACVSISLSLCQSPVLVRLQGEYNTAEEALDATGWLADRPPQAHGETGHAFYTVQVGGCCMVLAWWSGWLPRGEGAWEAPGQPAAAAAAAAELRCALLPRPPVPRLQPTQLLSLYPRAYLLPKFLDKARCQHVIDMASKRLAPSGRTCWPVSAYSCVGLTYALSRACKCRHGLQNGRHSGEQLSMPHSASHAVCVWYCPLFTHPQAWPSRRVTRKRAHAMCAPAAARFCLAARTRRACWPTLRTRLRR